MKKLFSVFVLILIVFITSCNSDIDNTNKNNTSDVITIDRENKDSASNMPNEHDESNKPENWVFVERINGNDLKIVNDNYLIYENDERNIYLYNMFNNQTILLDKNVEKKYYNIFYADNSLVYATSSVDNNLIKIVKWDITNIEKIKFEYHYNDKDYLVESIDSAYVGGKVYHAIQGLNGKSGILIMKDDEIDEYSIDKSFDVVRSPKPLISFDSYLYIKISNENFYLFDKDNNNLIKTDSFSVKNNIKYILSDESLNILGEENQILNQFTLPLRLESWELNHWETPYFIFDLYKNKALISKTSDSDKTLSIFVDDKYVEVTNIDSLRDAKFIDDNSLIYNDGKQLFLYEINKNRSQKIHDFDDYIRWIKLYVMDSQLNIFICTEFDVLYKSTISLPFE